MGYIAFALIIILSLSSQAFARPVSYMGGTMIMAETDHMGRRITGQYSPTAFYSLGAFVEQDTSRRKDYDVYGIKYSHLLKRWNLDKAQSNIFLTGMVGIAELNNETSFTNSYELAADYETRKFYIAYSAMPKYIDDIEKTFGQRFRTGFAPILADYGNVQPWLILQADHHPGKEEAFVITPIIRAYYTESLLEFGISNNKDILFNLSLQF